MHNQNKVLVVVLVMFLIIVVLNNKTTRVLIEIPVQKFKESTRVSAKEPDHFLVFRRFTIRSFLESNGNVGC